MFHPNMRSTTDGFTVVGGLKYRSFKDAVADVWEVDGKAGAGGEYQSPHPRLFVLLERAGAGTIQIGAEGDVGRATASGAKLSYIPAGLKTWSYVPAETRLRHLDLHFDAATFSGRFSGEFDSALLAEPRLMFDDPDLLALANLLASECERGDLNDLYGEGIALAMLTRLFRVRQAMPRPGQLSAHRLRQAMDFIEANCLRKIRLQELADLAGLSQSHFSFAFKASTGVAPHQWQMQTRIERMKLMLVSPGATLTEVAIAAGFSDQAHMTRIFKRHAGMTPAAWLRNQGSR